MDYLVPIYSVEGFTYHFKKNSQYHTSFRGTLRNTTSDLNITYRDNLKVLVTLEVSKHSTKRNRIQG